jgi:hypothetical protein
MRRRIVANRGSCLIGSHSGIAIQMSNNEWASRLRWSQHPHQRPQPGQAIHLFRLAKGLRSRRSADVRGPQRVLCNSLHQRASGGCDRRGAHGGRERVRLGASPSTHARGWRSQASREKIDSVWRGERESAPGELIQDRVGSAIQVLDCDMFVSGGLCCLVPSPQ